jgi:hypothetical protein
MTDLDVYQPAAGIGQYQAGIVVTPESAKALDDQLRACMKAVLREGTDYGHIPGTNGDEKSLWRPGAQKMLQWFRLECTCDRIEVERDDEGLKHGITYRAEVGRGLKTATPVILATCEGTADYDEKKFYKTAEQVQRDAETAERRFAEKDKRPPRPTRWQGLPEYRADWNALMKRAQKRAIVGAVVDATAAGGIFTDREEDDSSPVPQDGGPSWYEQAIELALASTETEPGGELQDLFTGAAQAHKDGLISRRQQDHVQNTVRQRLALLKKAAVVVEAEDLGRQAPAEAADDGRRHVPVPESEKTNVEDEPGSVGDGQLRQLHTILAGLGFNGEDREQKLTVAEVITGRAPLTGPVTKGRSSKNLSFAEAKKLIDKLDEFTNENGERDRDALIAYMAEREQAGDGGD